MAEPDPNDWSPRGGWKNNCFLCGEPIEPGSSDFVAGSPHGIEYAHAKCDEISKRVHSTDKGQLEFCSSQLEEAEKILKMVRVRLSQLSKDDDA